MVVLLNIGLLHQRDEIQYSSRVDKVVQQYSTCIASAGSLCRATVDEQPDLNLAPQAIFQRAGLRMSTPPRRGEGDNSMTIGKHTCRQALQPGDAQIGRTLLVLASEAVLTSWIMGGQCTAVGRRGMSREFF